MESFQLDLGIFDLVGVIMLVLSGTSFIYLLRIKNKSDSTQMLLWFFLCVGLSSITTIVTNIGTAWDWAFAPAQDALLILGGVFLVRFAYLYPDGDQPGEARWVVGSVGVLALIALTYAVSFAIRYIANIPGDLNENQLYYLLTPVTIGLGVVVFFRRSLHWSAQAFSTNPVKAQPIISALKSIFFPRNRPAAAQRAYGLSLAIGLMPVVVVMIKSALPGVFASFLFNFGAVIAVSALMLTYFNFAPEPVTISAKLVGISLVSFLLILGLAGVWLFETNPTLGAHRLVLLFITLVFISSFLIILIFPLFFRTALLDPLEKLLKGVKIANEGDLSVQVGVQYDDEIGYLTQSFNRMVSSLNEATQALRGESQLLERQVQERTKELQYLNQQLLSENFDRIEAQAVLDRQLRYEKALANCSQTLLIPADREESQYLVLNKALEYLRAGAQASRAYVIRNYLDNDLGLCMSILAEACAEEILPHISNPGNQKFPWSQLPKEMLDSLGDGYSFGGPVERVFASTPQLLKAFLNQHNPLLSIQTLPIFLNNQWWGFIGLDDCEKPREWDQDEILLLHTAAEMIGSTLRRWEVETYLRETLENLEQRIYARTIELTQSNTELRHEINERQRFQDRLEERLEVERMLANISARLLSPLELSEAILETLTDLGALMQATHVLFIQLFDSATGRSGEAIEWHLPEALPLSGNLMSLLHHVYPWIRSQLDGAKTVFIKDISSILGDEHPDRQILINSGVNSMLLTSLCMDDQLEIAISIGNPKLSIANLEENIKLVEVIVGMLGSLVRREALLNTLEEKVAERTRELSAFFDMAMLSGEAQELSDIMQPALVKVMEISASDAAIIHLHDEDEHLLRVVAQRGFTRESLAKLEAIPLDEPTLTWIIGHGEENWSSDVSSHPEVFELSQFPSDTHIMLRARGKIQGLLSCYRFSQALFNSYQLFFLSAICDQLGLAVENYRLRLKTEEVATIQERQRLARELHDAVSQSLYSLTLFARSGRDAYEVGNQAKLEESLVQVEQNSLAALKEMRLLLYQLRSFALEEGGLRQALETRFSLVERRSGILANVVIDESITLNEKVEQELFRLATEALNNALQHSGASQVSVSLQSENDQVVLVINDNGRGFDPVRAYAGMGLQNMRQRSSELGGRFEVSSQTGGDTQIRVVLPGQDILTGEGSHGQ